MRFSFRTRRCESLRQIFRSLYGSRALKGEFRLLFLTISPSAVVCKMEVQVGALYGTSDASWYWSRLDRAWCVARLEREERMRRKEERGRKNRRGEGERVSEEGRGCS